MIRIVHMIGSLEAGGSQKIIIDIYKGIDKSKFQFDFIAHDDSTYYEEEIKNMGGRIFRVPRFKGYNIREVIKAWNNLFSAHPEWQIFHSHVRSYASVLIPIAHKHGLKTVIHSHNISNGKGVKNCIKTFLQFPLKYQADYFLACSKAAGLWIFGKNVVNSNQFRVLKNGIDVKKFIYNENKRCEMRLKFNLGDSLVLGNVGRLVEQKNQKFLLDIFGSFVKLVPNAKLLIIGSGNLKSALVAKAQSLNIIDNIVWISNTKNVNDFYQAMDCFVFPSLWEGLGIVLIEAQINGLPCFVFDNIPEEADLKIKKMNYFNLAETNEAWADKIYSCLLSENKRNINGEVVAKNEGYVLSDTISSLSNVYESLLHDK